MLDLPSLHGDGQQSLFEHAVRVLRELRTRAGPESDAAARECRRVAGELGWITGCLSERGSDTQPLLTAGTLAEAHGYAGVLNPLTPAVVAGSMLLRAGVSREAPPLSALVHGRKLAVTPLGGADSDAARPRALYKRVGTRYRLTVRDALVPYATTLADYLVIPAEAESGDARPALFVVSAEHAVLAVERVPTSGGNYLCRVDLEDAAVEAPLAAGARVTEALRWSEVLGVVLTAAELAGIGRAALELTLEYAKSRVQFGRPIGSFQAVHHHFADMLRDLVATRLLVAQAASRLDRGLPAEREASMAKTKAAEAIPALLRMAHQITGGAGFYRDYPLEGYMRRAIDLQAAYGNGLQHRRRLVRMLRDDPVAFRGPDAHPLGGRTS